MTGSLHRRLAALEAQQPEQVFGVVILPTWLAEVDREAWIAARVAELPELPSGQSFVVIPDKGSVMEGGHA